jgi:hypothetical protein
VQARDMGIIKNLKMLYRGKLVNHILDAIEDNLLTSFFTAKEVSSVFSRQYSLLPIVGEK